MQVFGILGLLSLLVAVAIGVTLFATNTNNQATPNDQNKGAYQEALDSAHEAAQQAGDRANETNLLLGKQVVVYDGISVPETSVSLDLSNKGLSRSLKAEVRLLTNLQELNLSNNNFTGLPAEVGQLSQLEILNLSNNPLTGLPQELGNLKNLKILDLRGTNYAVQDLVVIKQGLPNSTQILID